MVFDGVVAGPVLVTDSSALVATVVVAIEVLFALLVSGVAEETIAVLVMTVPNGVAGETWTITVNVAVAPGAIAAMLQETVAPVVQLKAGPVSCVSETKVVPGGRTSVQLTFAASEGPALATEIV